MRRSASLNTPPLSMAAPICSWRFSGTGAAMPASRSGASSLPLNACVEIAAIVEVAD